MGIPCAHWRACGVKGGGCCAVAYKRRPSFGACLLLCDRYVGPPRPPQAETIAMLKGGVKLRVHGTCGGAKPAVRPAASNGLGDKVERVIKAATFGKVPSCRGCIERKQWLNKMFPGRRAAS